jgi:hypothetical protein
MAAAELVAVMVLPVLVDAQMACAGGFERADRQRATSQRLATETACSILIVEITFAEPVHGVRPALHDR